ncbi:hypothetical protein Vadar_015910 [Vaccinium darrowii]|uniref:Uncharacterized protein n=1 Tax=Vaccinium darrowii TaxID=229202 RepID=A0ACB7XIJ2_9ERIC|nr:hypothetical protein Vadar_015910 [Vaccinium darrowii]
MNSKIALLGVLPGEKCKAACNSVSKSVKTLQGLRQVLVSYLHQEFFDSAVASSRFVVSKSPNNCYDCGSRFVMQCLEIFQARVFLFSFLLLSKTVDAQSCEATMGLLRPCFGYMAAPPFGGSMIPSELCCNSFRHSYRVGDERCLCHLLMKTSPITIEADRLFQLDQTCGTKQSLRKLCEDVPLSAPPPPPLTPPLRPWTQITPPPVAPHLQQRTRLTVVLATTFFLGIVAFSLLGWIMLDLYRALGGSLLLCFVLYTLVLICYIDAISSVAHDGEDDFNMEVDTATSAIPAPVQHSLLEFVIYCYFLVLIFLIHQRRYNETTIDVLAARLYFSYSLSYELSGVAEIRGNLIALHRIATLRALSGNTPNLLLWNYLHYNLFDHAEKLRSKAPHFEERSNQQPPASPTQPSTTTVKHSPTTNDHREASTGSFTAILASRCQIQHRRSLFSN